MRQTCGCREVESGSAEGRSRPGGSWQVGAARLQTPQYDLLAKIGITSLFSLNLLSTGRSLDRTISLIMVKQNLDNSLFCLTRTL